MIIRFLPAFRRSLKKLTPEQKQQVSRTVTIFARNPFDPKLRNHKLQGEHKETRSISAGYDLRILYREEGGHILVFFIDVGSHDEVY